MTPEQKAQLPKMTGGDGAATANAIGPVQSNAVNTASKAQTPEPTPQAQTPRPPAPDFEAYWADDKGRVWRKLPVPAVILGITSAATQIELDAVLRALLEGSR